MLDIVNRGLKPDGYDFSYSASPLTISVPGSLALGAVSRQDFEVLITAPAGAMPGDSFDVTFKAVSKATGYSESMDLRVSVVASGAEATPHMARSAEVFEVNDFSFQPITDAQPDMWVESQEIVLSGMTVPVPIQVRGGSLSINGGEWTNDLLDVQAGDKFRVRVQASPLAGGGAEAVVAVGGQVQAFRVTTKAASQPTQTWQSPNGVSVKLASGGAQCSLVTNRMTVVPATTMPVAPPAGLGFPFGVTSLATVGCEAGSAQTFTLTYPQPLPAGAKYWKFGRTPNNRTAHWYELPANIAGNTVSFTITDGGLGDDDLTANGSITDPGGPAAIGAQNWGAQPVQPPAPPVQPVPGQPGQPGGQPGQPGQPDPAIQPIPTLQEWAMVLMALLLAASAVATGRRRED